MYIDDILISKDISIRELAGKGYKVHHGLRTSRIKTAPQTVLFLKQEFLAEFLFSGNNIWKILLYICPDEEMGEKYIFIEGEYWFSGYEEREWMDISVSGIQHNMPERTAWKKSV